MKIFSVSEIKDHHLIVMAFLNLITLYLPLSDALSYVLCYLLCSAVSHPALLKRKKFEVLLCR